jgi:hypothetical protein
MRMPVERERDRGEESMGRRWRRRWGRMPSGPGGRRGKFSDESVRSESVSEMSGGGWERGGEV